MKPKDIFFEDQNQNCIFQKLKLFNMKYFVCVNELEQSITNLSFIFYLNKILTLTNMTQVFLKIFF